MKRHIDPRALAREAEIQGMVGALQMRLRRGDRGRAEGLVHELCHAAVFDLRVVDARIEGRRLGDEVEFIFGCYEDLRASDASECAALAVEKVVLRRLRWGLDFAKIEASAGRGLMVLTDSEMRAAIHRAGARKITLARARRVLRWLSAIGQVAQ